VFLANIQSSKGGSPINVRGEHKDLGGADLRIDDAPDLNAEGATSQNIDVVGYIVIRQWTELLGKDCDSMRVCPADALGQVSY
jgi:hypothetical protein